MHTIMKIYEWAEPYVNSLLGETPPPLINLPNGIILHTFCRLLIYLMGNFTHLLSEFFARELKILTRIHCPMLICVKDGCSHLVKLNF